MSEIYKRHFITEDGVTLVGDVGGAPDAPSVILLHGGGQTRHAWAGAMRRLIADGYHVVNYDARGHGESGWSESGDYSIPTLASDLRSVLATVSGPAAVVGASMGGMTSYYAIGASDDRIAMALVMVDVVLRPAKRGAERILSFMKSHEAGFGDLDEAAAAVAAYTPQRTRPRDPEGLMKNLRRKPDGRLYWHWDPRLLDDSPNSRPPTSLDKLPDVSGRVTLPILLVRGLESDVVDDDGVADMTRRLPQTEVYNVPGAAHMVVGDRNDAFNDGLTAFLSRHLPGAQG